MACSSLRVFSYGAGNMGFCSGWQLTENAGNQNSPGNTKWSMLIQNLDLEPLLVGGLEYEFYDFPYMFGRIIPTDFHSYFSEGLKPPTSLDIFSDTKVSTASYFCTVNWTHLSDIWITKNSCQFDHPLHFNHCKFNFNHCKPPC